MSESTDSAELKLKKQFSFSLVEDIRFCPASGKLYRQLYEMPDKYEPMKVVEKVSRRPKRPDLIGRTTGLSRLEYLGILFLQNEIGACMGQPAEQNVIFRRLRKEFPLWDGDKALKFFREFSKYRNNYNRGTLYAGQHAPVLYSFYYNERGYICHKLRRKDMLSFPYCRGELSSRKFADPRFFSPEELSELRQRQLKGNSTALLWNVPTEAEIRAIEAKIEKPLYDSVTFADGYGINSKIL